MKRLAAALLVLLLAPVSVLGASWTIMVWLNNQSNLAYFGHHDLNQMETCDYSQYGDDVQVIVLLGTTGGHYTKNAQLYYVEYDPRPYDGFYGMEHVISTPIDGHGIWSGTLDMDNDIQAFEDFVQWCVDNYPADHYLLSAWNHGDGIWLEEGRDWLTKGACGNLKLYDIADALANVGTFIDVMGYDVCLLGQIETGYQKVDGIVGIQIASPDLEPGEGWDYHAFQIFQEQHTVTPEQLAIRIVDDYLAYYTNPWTQAASDVKNWDTVMAGPWAEFCLQLINNTYDYQSRIVTARNSARTWNSTNERDLYDFISAIANDTNLPSELRAAATNLQGAYHDYLLAGGVHNTKDPSGGLSIWFPTNGPNNPRWYTYLSKIKFSETLWTDFLEMYADPYPVAPVVLNLENVVFDDGPGGNGDGKLDPGETIQASLTLTNSGQEMAEGVSAVVVIDDAHLTVTEQPDSFGNIPSGGSATQSFTFTVATGCPTPYHTAVQLNASAGDDYSNELIFPILVGAGVIDDMESGDHLWTTGGLNSQWHLTDEDASSGSFSWKCGSTGSGNYNPNQNSWVMCAPVYIDADHNTLTFQTRYSLLDDYDYVHLQLDAGAGWTNLASYNGDQTSWHGESFDLSAYNNSHVRLRFTFNPEFYIGTREGFFFDDFFIANNLNVTLVELEARATSDGLLVSWGADDPAGILGVEVLRETPAGYLPLHETAITGTSYLDRDVEPGRTYSYKVRITEIDGSRATFGPVSAMATPLSARSLLGQSYPNPAASAVTIPLELAEAARVSLHIYDLAGRRVATVHEGHLSAGRHNLAWNAEGLESGVYLVRLEGESLSLSRRMVITR